ncbi:MAG TPA: histidine kinase, partial [Thermoleophilaceae bacterium]|nr:histidine kinase [Thermoleophilaceae bacterium]
LVLAAIAVTSSSGLDTTVKRVVIPAVFALSQGVPLLWRRKCPFAVLVFVVAANMALWAVSGTRPVPLAPMVALYTVAATTGRRTSLRGLAVTAVIGLPYAIDTLKHLSGEKFPFQIVRLGFEAATVAAAWFAGEMVRARRAYLAELEARALRAEREREAEAARAVAEEKARIARELHDVIAHDVSLIVVQAGAAEEVFDERPDEVRAVLRRIDEAGRDALAELRRLLGTVLPGDTDLRPQPSLARLDDLIDRVRASGLRVSVAVDGPARPLAAGLDLSAYRIVQEALTNVVRHAGASQATVTIAYLPQALELTVSDDGRGANNGWRGHGKGIVGMRERASLVNGRVEAGPLAGGGFEVHAVLPLEPQP